MAEPLLADVLRDMERQLLLPDVRTNASALRLLLAPDFMEFGSSGRIFNLDRIISLLAAEQAGLPVERQPVEVCLEDFRCTSICHGAVLVTYRLVRGVAGDVSSISLRSSLWARDGEQWKMRFHQSTPAGPV